jgi:DNA-binding NarL/FixJ family response regulator
MPDTIMTLDAESTARVSPEPVDPSHHVVAAQYVLGTVIEEIGVDDDLVARLEEVAARLSAIARELDAPVGTITESTAATVLYSWEAMRLLTRSERRIVPLIAQRMTTKEISARLSISRNTVKTHLHSIYRKLGVSSRFEAIDRLYSSIA